MKNPMDFNRMPMDGIKNQVILKHQETITKSF